MSTFLTNDTKAIILLCGVLGKDRSLKPLTQGEYSALVQWLIGKEMRPEDLLEQDDIEEAAKGARIDIMRFKALLGRGVQLGFAVEEWQRNGIWIISRSDKDYPERYKKHLKYKAPPLLFGIGDRSLLQGGGVAIVGSRNVDLDGQTFTRQAAELCASNGMPVVSGGARGVDQIAMTAALDAGGVTIGVLAENLLKKSLERSARNAIAKGRMILISPYHPNASFTVGTAMGRNKLIYALADYGLVVNAEHKKGGTWTGATEELKRENALAVFIRTGANVPLGNKKLLEFGALEWPEIKIRENLSQQLADLAVKPTKKNRPEDLNIFDSFEQQVSQVGEPEKPEKIEILPVEPDLPVEPEAENIAETAPEDAIYEVVLPVIINQLGSPATVDGLAEKLNVSKTQLNIWLKKAVEQGKICKLLRPVRYCKMEKV